MTSSTTTALTGLRVSDVRNEPNDSIRLVVYPTGKPFRTVSITRCSSTHRRTVSTAMIFILIYFVTCAWAQPAGREELVDTVHPGGAGMILTGSEIPSEELYVNHSHDMSPNHYVNHLDFHMVADDCDFGLHPSLSESSDQSCSQDSDVALQRRQLQDSLQDLSLIPGGGNSMRKRNSTAAYQRLAAMRDAGHAGYVFCDYLCTEMSEHNFQWLLYVNFVERKDSISNSEFQRAEADRLRYGVLDPCRRYLDGRLPVEGKAVVRDVPAYGRLSKGVVRRLGWSPATPFVAFCGALIVLAEMSAYFTIYAVASFEITCFQMNLDSPIVILLEVSGFMHWITSSAWNTLMHIIHGNTVPKSTKAVKTTTTTEADDAPVPAAPTPAAEPKKKPTPKSAPAPKPPTKKPAKKGVQISADPPTSVPSGSQDLPDAFTEMQNQFGDTAWYHDVDDAVQILVAN